MGCQIVYVYTISSIVGKDSTCSPDNKCEEDDGDCNTDDDCQEGLKCGTNNCQDKGGVHYGSDDDCCFMPEDEKPGTQ